MTKAVAKQKNSSFWERNRKSEGYLLKKTIMSIALKICRFILLFGMCFMILQPIFNKISVSFMEERDLYNPMVIAIPEHFTTENYRLAAELMAYSNTKIDYEYIINLIQNIVSPDDDASDVPPEEKQRKIDEVKQYVEELRKENPKIADIMSNLICEIESGEDKYKGKSILNIVENMKQDCIEKVIADFCVTWYASKEDVMYAATHYRDGVIPNESAIKATVDYASYKAAQERALPKFKYYAQMIAELRDTLDKEIKPLINLN